ncbi:MAG: hypothetical protein ACQEQD_10025 [Bacillota bacterium]
MNLFINMVVTEDQIKEYMDSNYEEFMRKHMNLEGPFEITSEYTLPNGQQVDKVIFGTNKEILALIECKGEVGTNDFVRGTGQAIQGKYHIKKNMTDNFSENAKSFLVIPVEMAKKVALKLFDYSEYTLILVNLSNNQSLEYRPGDYISEETDNWVTVNPYYFRDSSLEGIYFYLRMILKNSGLRNPISFSQMEIQIKEIRKQFNESHKKDMPFFGDIRNNHIVPSVLGFYDPASKRLTERGYKFARKSFIQFCKELVLTEFKEYSQAIFTALLWISKDKTSDENGFYSILTSEISEFIINTYDEKKVTYLNDPDGGTRNISTIIRMLETIGAIQREGRSKFKINYFPLEGMPFKMTKTNFETENFKFWFEKFDLDYQ